MKKNKTKNNKLGQRETFWHLKKLLTDVSDYFWPRPAGFPVPQRDFKNDRLQLQSTVSPLDGDISRKLLDICFMLKLNKSNAQLVSPFLNNIRNSRNYTHKKNGLISLFFPPNS